MSDAVTADEVLHHLTDVDQARQDGRPGAAEPLHDPQQDRVTGAQRTTT